MYCFKKAPLFISLLVTLLCVNCSDNLKEINVDKAVEKEIAVEITKIFEEVAIPLSIFQEKNGKAESIIHLFEQSSITPKDYQEIGIDDESLFKKLQNLYALLEQLTYFENEDIILQQLTDLSIASILSSKLLSAPLNIRNTGTPCYDSFEIDVYAASSSYAICLLSSSGSGLVLCTVLYAASILVAEYNYDSCMVRYNIE
ncbi:MAG: hypothetical protein R2828_19315 [Saprospiraceae bacterium]